MTGSALTRAGEGKVLHAHQLDPGAATEEAVLAEVDESQTLGVAATEGVALDLSDELHRLVVVADDDRHGHSWVVVRSKMDHGPPRGGPDEQTLSG